MSDYFTASVKVPVGPYNPILGYVGPPTLIVDVADLDRMVYISGAGGNTSLGFTDSSMVFPSNEFGSRLSFLLPAGVQLWGCHQDQYDHYCTVIVTKSPSSLSLGFCS